MSDFEKAVSAAVCAWYKAHGRNLPWRAYKDPYHIWISEIMLQQTQAATVIPYYERFISRLPDVYALAEADPDLVYKLWEGLGYYRRAAHLKETAEYIAGELGGVFPERYEDLLRLKGIGDYTASAIMGIAYGMNKGVVDGNILRILSRLFAREDNIALYKTKRIYGQIMDRMTEGVSPSDFNQGMMDLGAMICTPRKPDCEHCPLKKLCAARASDTQQLLPVNIKKTGQKKEDYMTAVIRWRGKYLLFKNTGGMLENLYGFVQFPSASPTDFEKRFEETYGGRLRLTAYVKDVRHVFTHRIWQMHVYTGELDAPDSSLLKHLYTLSEVAGLPISTAHLKVFKAAENAAAQGEI